MKTGKKLKKWIALLLSFVMILTMMPVTAFAEGPSRETDQNIEYEGDESGEADQADTYEEDILTPEMPEFLQTVEVDDADITVYASEGVFPQGAVLAANKVSADEQKKAAAAVEEVRDAERNVAASYTFDIKVLDKDGITELEPADQAKVKVYFSLKEVADQKLEAVIYRVTEDEETGELSAEKLDVISDLSDEDDPYTVDPEDTVMIETDRFSYYTVEFTNEEETSDTREEKTATAEEEKSVDIEEESASAEDGEPADIKTGKKALKANQARDTEANVEVSSWTGLQDAIDASGGGTVIMLTDSIQANGEDCIQVTSGKNVTIDLNGKTMDRGLTNSSCIDKGSVIRVESGGALTIRDRSDGKNGTITGGASTFGGGIYNAGTLCVENVTITGNAANKADSNRGGGIYNIGTLTMIGGTVSNNTGNDGGGISNFTGGTATLDGVTVTGNRSASHSGGGILNHGTLSLSDCQITGNTAKNNGAGIWNTGIVSAQGSLTVTGNKGSDGSINNNFYLTTGTVLNVSGQLAADAQIGVTMENPGGNITYGLKDMGGADSFTSDVSDYNVSTDAAGEACLTKEANQTVDSWAGLQSAINNSGSGDLIKLSGDVLNTNGKDRIKIDGKKVTIDLAGHTVDRKRTSVDGDGHVFELMNNASLTIRDSEGGGKITGGYSKRGGGIYVGTGCVCVITGGTITGNKASVDGGGIYVRGTLKMSGGAVIKNHADDTGGGIYVTNEGRFDLTGAEITYNTAKNNGGGMKVHLSADSSISHCQISYNESGEYGGGIHFDESSRKLTISDTKIDQNKSKDDGAGIYLRYGTITMTGGSLSNNYSENDGGGAKITKDTTFTADGVVINKNTARDEEGGGIKNFGTTTLKNCDITNNQANKHGGGVFNDDNDGSEGILKLENCTITGNSTKQNGGGVYSDMKLTVIGGSVTGNTASDRGGGIFIGDDSEDTGIGGALVVKDNGAQGDGPNIYLRTHMLVVESRLTEDARIGITKENDKGLGAFTKGYGNKNGTEDPSSYFFSPEGLDIVLNSSGEASLSSTWPSLRNEIINAADGEIITLDHNYTASKSDDYLEIPENKTITIDLNGYTLNRNRTKSDGDGHVFWVKENANLTLVDSTASENSIGRGAITGGYSKRGGGIYVDEGATCTVSGINIKENRASDDGGGVYVKGTLKMTNCIVVSNAAEDCGGGIFSEEDLGKVELENVTITNNLAGDDGGGLKLWLREDSSIKKCEIKNNTSSDCGGGLYMSAKGRKLTITDTNIDGNQAGDDGAGIHLWNGTIEMTGGSISGNTAENDSGGIKVDTKTTFIANNVTISNNKASKEEGGGVKTYGETTLTGCTISGNSAAKQGGGIFNDNDGKSEGKLTIDGCTITGNKTDEDGGGIYSDKKLTIKGTTTIGSDAAGGTEAGNEAENRGGGFYIGKDSETTDIQGSLVIKGNSAATGDDVFLRPGQILNLTGAITGTDIGILDMEQTGVLTRNYSKYHPEKDADGNVISDNDPGKFFCTSELALDVEWNDDKTEARLKSDWPELQAMIDEAKDGGIVTLDQDYRAGSDDISLQIDEGYDLTIDLNGHTLNRNLNSVKRVKGSDYDHEDAGHVIAVYNGGTLTIKDSKANEEGQKRGLITGGYARKGGGICNYYGGKLIIESGTIFNNKAASDDGGGIYNAGELVMTGGIVAGNVADDNGGGIGSSYWSHMSLKNVTVYGNTAGDNGGGLNICLYEDATIEDCMIEKNSSSDYGGGMRLDAKDRTLTIRNTKIENNTSIDDGGGIYLHYGTINMIGDSPEKCTIKDNTSFNDGGGAKITKDTIFTADGVTISGNKAYTEEGGGIKTYGTTTLTGCTIEGNNAAKQGGGIYNDSDDGSDGELTIENCTIKSNISQDDGGGIYSDEELKIIGGDISENKAYGYGGGVFVGKGSSNTGIQGNPLIQNNTASNAGSNLYLRPGRKLELTGALTSEANICVDLQDGTGVLTQGYKSKNGETDPKTFFTFAPGYGTKFTDKGEVEIYSNWSALKKKIENAKSGEMITLDMDYAASDSDDRIKIDGKKSITVELNGHILNRNRRSEDSDGHVFEVFEGSTLTIMDSSFEQTGKIMGGWAERGGGINVHENAVLDLQGGTITGNRADTNGGGIFVKGTLNMTGGSVDSNKTDGSGGGIYMVSGSTLDLEGGKIEKNDAAANGGGIMIEDNAAIRTKTSPVVTGNHASKKGSDIFLPSQNALQITGQFTEGAKIGIALQSSRGVFTSGYSRWNQDQNPDQYFVSTESYAVYTQNGEAALGLGNFGETDYTSPFISWNNQIDTESSKLGSQNWMAGISGERYLNEINLPRSHDSGMNKIDDKNVSQGITTGVAGISLIGTIIAGVVGASGVGFVIPATLFGVSAIVSLAMPSDFTSTLSYFLEESAAPKAKTQTEFIDQQLNDGVRRLDIRLNNQYKDYKWYVNGWLYEDDGRNLWLCHGKSGGGTYYALRAEDSKGDDYLSFDQVLIWTKEFLTEHPTETVILNLTPETEETDQIPKIRKRARTILEASALQKNPSTGEPFLYKEPGSDDYFAPYTRSPKLADCRGKIVLLVDSEFASYVGGQVDQWVDIDHNAGMYFKNTPSMHIDNAYELANKLGLGNTALPTDADTHFDYDWFWGLSCTGQEAGINYASMDPPYKLAEEVNAALIGDDKLLGSGMTGKYMGCVSMDNVKAEYVEQIWRTNFFDELNASYRTVTVKSGLDGSDKYPDQTYKLLKGTEIEIPGNIYKQVDPDQYLECWRIEGSEGSDWWQGDRYKVDEDVTFVAQWLTNGNAPVRIVWKDGDDADKLRPASIKLKCWTNNDSVDVTLSSEDSWRGIVKTVNGAATIVPKWDLIDSTAENPSGQDAEGQYRYILKFEEGEGYILTLVHTPGSKVQTSGTIVWSDEENAAGNRPDSVTVHLLRNGKEIDSRQVFAGEDGSWSYDFGSQPLYEEGEPVSYQVIEDEVDNYTYDVDGFSITNTYSAPPEKTVSVLGTVEWDDAVNAMGIRPEKVLVTLLSGEEEAGSQETAAVEGTELMAFRFDDLPMTDAGGTEIKYTIVPADVPGYSYTYEQITMDTEGLSDEDSEALNTLMEAGTCLFRITYTLDVADDTKTQAAIDEHPTARELSYTGKTQALIDEGKAYDGEMMYTLGTDDKTAPEASDYSKKIPSGKDAGIYYVWYYAKGDAMHTDTEPECLQVQIAKADQSIDADDIEGFAGERGKTVNAAATGVKGATEGVGTLSYKVKDGAEFASVDASTGELTLLSPGTATVTVTAAATDNYNAASKDVEVNVTYAKHTVTFYSDTAGTEVWKTAELEDGVLLDDLADYGTQGENILEKAGYTLAGWATEPGIVVDSYKDKRGELNKALKGKLVDWTASIEGDIDAYPIWICDRLEVHLISGGNETAPVTWGVGSDGLVQSDSFTVNIDEKLDMTGLNSTTRKGYRLDGWYTKGGVKWDENGKWGVTPEYCDKGDDGEAVIQINEKRRYKYYTVTLTARWTPEETEQGGEQGTYTITFDSMGGSDVAPITQESGTDIVPPDAPTKEHYDFAGWHPALPDTMPAENITVKAGWEPKTYYFGFYDGNSQLSVLSGIFGSVVNAPKDPVKEGFVFSGWLDEEGNTVAFPQYMPDTGLMKVFAKWKTAQEAPEVNAEAVDAYSVKITEPVDGAEYIIVLAGKTPDAKDWTGAKQLAADEETIVFGGLNPVTAYDVWARMLETEDAARSDAAKVTVTTKCTQTEHDWGEWEVSKEPTDTEEGEETRICKNDPSHIETRMIPAKTHVHSLTKVEAKAATCTGDGNIEYWVCDQGEHPCGRYFSDAEGTTEIEAEATIVKATGHSWGEWQTTKEATLTSDGVETRVCGNDPSHKETRSLPKKGNDPSQKAEDGTDVGPGASAACADKAITGMTNDNDPAGSLYSGLQLRSTRQTKTAVTLKWSKPKGTNAFVLYGNKCGKSNKMKKIGTYTGTSRKLTKVAGQKAKKGTYYKFILVALDKNGNVISTSKVIHVATKGGKVTNPKKVTTKKGKKTVSKVTVKKSKTVKIKSSVVKANKKLKLSTHRKIKYESSNPGIASVSAKGVIKGKKKGTCYVYAYAQNGFAKKLKVTVK